MELAQLILPPDEIGGDQVFEAVVWGACLWRFPSRRVQSSLVVVDRDWAIFCLNGWRTGVVDL